MTLPDLADEVDPVAYAALCEQELSEAEFKEALLKIIRGD
jgi:hypothetical protein